MPAVKSITERYEKFKAKMAPDRVGSRYDAVKSIALERYLEGSAGIVSIREHARDLLSHLGVPAGDWPIYLSFVLYLVTKENNYSGKTLAKRILGAKANWVARGADPAILDKLVRMVFGTHPEIVG